MSSRCGLDPTVRPSFMNAPRGSRNQQEFGAALYAPAAFSFARISSSTNW